MNNELLTIYKIESVDGLYRYIGSTTDFQRRVRDHKTRCTNANDKGYNCLIYRTIRAEGGWDSFTKEVIAIVRHRSKDEGRRIERFFINLYGTNMNEYQAFQSHEELLEYDRVRSNRPETRAKTTARNASKVPCKWCNKTMFYCNLKRHSMNRHLAEFTADQEAGIGTHDHHN